MMSDLFDNIDKSKKFDVILFNPPYLPTDGKTRINTPLNTSLDGGIDGRKVIDRFIIHVSQHLSKKGRILMLDSSLDNTDETIKRLEALRFKTQIILSQSFFFEKLNVILVER